MTARDWLSGAAAGYAAGKAAAEMQASIDQVEATLAESTDYIDRWLWDRAIRPPDRSFRRVWLNGDQPVMDERHEWDAP